MLQRKPEDGLVKFAIGSWCPEAPSSNETMLVVSILEPSGDSPSLAELGLEGYTGKALHSVEIRLKLLEHEYTENLLCLCRNTLFKRGSSISAPCKGKGKGAQTTSHISF
jgi:hypothetical protein